MRITRLVVGTASVGLLGLVPVAVAAPGNATVTLTTTTVAAASETELEYGDDISVSNDIDGSDGSSVYKGVSTLLALEAGAADYVPVATAEGSASFYDVKPNKNTTYKVVYAGYTATTTYEDTYTPSESAPFTVTVARKITAPSSGFVLKGKVTPDYAKKKIKISVSKKQKKGFKSFKTIKTDKKGKYKVTLPKRGGTWYWLISVKGDDSYEATGYVWRTFVS